MEPKDFISKYANSVKQACKDTGLFASVCLAQAALETGWGRAVKGNNLFGIKASGNTNKYWKGKYFIANTFEYIKGVRVNKQCAFRQYDSVVDGICDRNLLFLRNKRYANVLIAKTPEEQAKEIKKAGYATGLKYAEKLINIINKYNLKQFD